MVLYYIQLPSLLDLWRIYLLLNGFMNQLITARVIFIQKDLGFSSKILCCCTTSMKLPHDEVWRSQKSRLSQHPLPFVCPLSGHSNVKLDRVNLSCVICHVVQPIFRKCFKENWFFTKSVAIAGNTFTYQKRHTRNSFTLYITIHGAR